MTVFLTNRTTKEISIRKVLGASVSGLVRLISWQTSRLVLIALVIASPLAYFATSAYLNFFSNKIDLSLFFFVKIGVGVMILAWLVVGYQAWRAATANPADALRYE